MNERPWNFHEAQQALRQASVAQRTAEVELQDAYRRFAESEFEYRKALAVEIVKCHSDGIAWSTAPDIARGDPYVAKLRMERDIQEGVREAMNQAAWRRNADRKDAQRLADWSQRREIAEFHGEDPDPAPMDLVA